MVVGTVGRSVLFRDAPHCPSFDVQDPATPTPPDGENASKPYPPPTQCGLRGLMNGCAVGLRGESPLTSRGVTVGRYIIALGEWSCEWRWWGERWLGGWSGETRWLGDWREDARGVGELMDWAPRCPSEFLEYDSRIPPFTRPPCMLTTALNALSTTRRVIDRPGVTI